MTAGVNCLFDVWRVRYGPNDVVGGAVITGTYAYQNVKGFLQQEMPSQLLLQQGLETVRTFTMTVVPGTLDIWERDEIIVREPFDQIYHDKYFRVVGVRYSSHNPRDPRNYMSLSLVRSERAHANNTNQ